MSNSTHTTAAASSADRGPRRLPGAAPRQGRKPRGDQFWSGGEPMVWVAGGALAAVLLGALTLLAVVLYNGLGVFWPAAVEQVQLANGTRFLGRRLDSHTDPQRGAEVRFKTANREFDPQRQDFRWVLESDLAGHEYPPDAMVLERQANGEFYGRLARPEDARAGDSGNQRPGPTVAAGPAGNCRPARRKTRSLAGADRRRDRRAQGDRTRATQGRLPQAAGRRPHPARCGIRCLAGKPTPGTRHRGGGAAKTERTAGRRAYGSRSEVAGKRCGLSRRPGGANGPSR